MEGNNEKSGVSSYYHHPHPPQSQPQTTIPSTSNPNGSSIISSPSNNKNNVQMVFSHAVPMAVSTTPLKRKRGRPRKYGTPEQPKRDRFSNHVSNKDPSFVSSNKSHFAAPGQGFTPHVIFVNPGEDVGQKISSFMQQSNRDICILSASGSVSSASLSQPATSGGSITYEGRFEILILKGSYVRSEFGGRTGGISVCLAGEGQIFGGGLGGPLIAAGPVQVILASFVIDAKKDMPAFIKVDAPARKMASPVGGTSDSGVSFRSPVNSPHESIGGGQFGLHPHVMHMTPSQSTEWRGSLGHGMQQSPENGNYEHMPE